MDEIQELFEKQAQWQRARAKLSWGDKLRASLAMRESLKGFSKSGGRPNSGSQPMKDLHSPCERKRRTLIDQELAGTQIKSDPAESTEEEWEDA